MSEYQINYVGPNIYEVTGNISAFMRDQAIWDEYVDRLYVQSTAAIDRIYREMGLGDD